jgi:mono/diheme cytochrome c family protein
MRRALLSTLAFVCGAMAAATQPALAQGGDSAAGARLAQEHCAACHAVGADPHAKSPNAEAPSFALVAHMPSTTELSLKVFLRSSHKNMPNFILSSEDIDSVSAYILGLKKK